MRILLIIYFFFNTFVIYSQNYGMLFTGIPQKSAEKYFDKQIKKGQKNNSITFSSKSIVGDTLTYYVRRTVDCFSIKMTFNFDSPLSKSKCCDYQEISFECQTCAKKSLEEIKKANNFRQKSENSFLSSYFYQTEMTVQYDLLGIDILKLIFKPVNLPRNEYKEYYKTLKKKNRITGKSKT